MENLSSSLCPPTPMTEGTRTGPVRTCGPDLCNGQLPEAISENQVTVYSASAVAAYAVSKPVAVSASTCPTYARCSQVAPSRLRQA